MDGKAVDEILKNKAKMEECRIPEHIEKRILLALQKLPGKRRTFGRAGAVAALWFFGIGLSVYAAQEPVEPNYETVIIQPVAVFVNFLGYLIGLAVLGAIAWLVINRKNKTPLYQGVLWSLFFPTWACIGLIYALGPWHNLRAGPFRFIGYIVAGPFYLLTQFFGGHTHFLVVFFFTVLTGFCLGLVLGFLRKLRFLNKQA